MARKTVIGNWKLHGSIGQIKTVLGDLAKANVGPNVGVCVPSPYIMLAKEVLKDSRIQVGAQDVSQYHIGAYTGEVSAAMLADVGCELVIVAHSERRRLFGASTETAGMKMRICIDAGLFPIYCVGESAEQRREGKTAEVIMAQMQVLKSLPVGMYAVAYEPTWAVGSGISATPDQIAEVHKMIKGELDDRVKLLYGGSVKADNAAAILAIDNVDGVLVGGAALTSEFVEICKAAA